MKIRSKRLVTMLLVATVTAAFSPSSSVAATEEQSAVVNPSVGHTIVLREDYETQLKEAKKKRDEVAQRQAELKRQQDALKSEYSSIEKYVEEMDLKQNEIMLQIAELENELEALNAELVITNQQLEVATEVADQQYENMKRRFQYLYEHGNITELEILMGSRNISDILNYDEYTMDIRSYDYQLALRYSAAKEEVQLVKNKLEAQIELLDSSKELYEQDYAYAQEVITKKQAALDDFAEKIGTNEEVLEEYMAELDKANADVNRINKELEKQRAREAEEAARKAAELAKQQQNMKYSDVPKTGYASAAQIPKLNVTDPAKMIWPLPGDSYTGSGFGPRRAPTKGASTFHKGVDIGGKFGAEIVAALAGTVRTAAYNSSAGNYIEIDHGNGYVTRYLHCSKLLVSKGDKVLQGQVIGLVGSTGVSTAPHLHFSVVIDGVSVDPLHYVRY
ncbi:MAG: peptidoglycan DD-metalloendopeptidase family protein [Lachnospiraceae bacterium]|nr:peptidoglycan DD-metalloendopeptidase family protein [Lachnospiraceae bacterium]